MRVCILVLSSVCVHYSTNAPVASILSECTKDFLLQIHIEEKNVIFLIFIVPFNNVRGDAFECSLITNIKMELHANVWTFQNLFDIVIHIGRKAKSI